MNSFQSLFPLGKPVIGMIHVPALPGTPANSLNPAQIIEKVLQEAKIYLNAGIDAIALENMHDTPYLNRKVGPEITATMAIVAHEVKKATGLPVGMQILAGANQEALAVAHVAGLDFIRAEGFVFGHVADEGWIDAQAGELLRYRKMIGADHILVFTDIKKKHSAHALTADVDLVETAKAAEFFRTDGLIITGSATGSATNPQELKRVRDAVKGPVLAGSGVTLENLEETLSHCDGVIVGSWFKKDGYWENELDPQRIADFMQAVKRFRK